MIVNDNPLQAFNTDDNSSVELTDFVPTRDEVAPVSNKASNVNLAAHAAMFSPNPGQVLDNYDAVVGQMSEEGKSSVADNLINSAQAAEHEKVKTILPTLLADQTISDEDKLKAVTNAFDEQSPIYHPANILASESLVQEIPNESVESENVRFDSAKMINEANQLKRAQQNLLNQELVKNNPSTVGKVMDIVQLMIPFANQYMTAKARAEVTGDTMWSYIKSFVAPGSARQDIRDYLVNTDPKNRVEMTQKLLDIINDSQGIVMSHPNDFARVNMMQEVVGQDGVSDVGKWVDNFAALADLAFGLGAVVKGAKGVRNISDAVSGFNKAEDFTGSVDFSKATSEARPKGYYPNKDEVEAELSSQIKDWEATKPKPTDFEKDVQASIDGSKKARRTSDEVDFNKAISSWKANKPKASDIEADMKRQVDNFNRRSGPRKSNNELGMEAAINSWKASQDVPNTVVSKVQPTSVSQVLKDTNSDKFRSLHDVMAGDESGKVAEAAYGTTREDAIVSDIAPQVATESGAVKAKVAVPDANVLKSLTPDPDLANFIKQDGAIYYTDAQKVANHSRITNDFQQAFGVTARKEMFQTLSTVESKLHGNTVKIKAVYGPQESGFSDPISAMNAVKFALRDYGVGDESLQLLKRVGGEYVPVDPKTVRGGTDPGFFNATSDADIKAAYDSGRYAETVVGGNKIRLVGADHGADVREVVAFDSDGKQIGNVLYGQGGERIDNPNVRVNPDWQRKGVANAMYDYAEAHGAKFPDPSQQQFSRSEAGQAFRDSRANSKRPKLEFSGNGGGDYLVQVDHDYKFNPFSMTDYPKNEVKNNWFMRSSVLQGSSGAGSLQRHLVNITSMLDPHITLSMSKAVTKSAGVMRGFLGIATDASRDFAGLKAREKSVVMDMIKEGNLKGKWWSETEMTAAGLSDKAKSSLVNWRRYWDNHFFFENMDHTKSLTNAGYMKFESGQNDINLWARPISVNNVPTNAHVYDPILDEVKAISQNDLADLYNKGGKIAELENVEIHGGKEFQYIISHENSSDGYLRAFNEFDQTLNYRPGYYHVAYKDPHFIIKDIVNDSGRVVGTRAVATASNLKDADDMVQRLKAMDGGSYTVRGAQKSEAGRARDYRSVQRAKGRSAQRFRGERLEDATSIISDPSHSHIQSPVEAMISSAKSISRRISMRDPIDAMKQGLMKQYEQFMPRVDGRARFPNNVLDITNPTGNSRLDKEVSAARSTFEYIQQMEGGYLNHIDDGYKAIMNKIGNMLGEASIDTKGVVSSVAQKAESAVRVAGTAKPSSVLRSGANTFFIVTNPIRQLLVQGHQIAQLVPMNPTFFGNPRNSAQIMFLLGKQMGSETNSKMLKFMGMTEKEANDLWDHFRLSGNFAAVDTHTMINGSLKNFVDGISPAQSIAGKVGQAISRPIGLVRKVGFDAGENLNQTAAWLVFRDRAIKSGKTMDDPAVRDWIAAEATNFTGNMNRAGQNAYEANALNVGLQFMGWAHRWGGIMTGNRVITKAEKTRLWAWQVLIYGIPGGYAGYGLFDSMLPDDPKTKDIIVQGLAGATYNKIASVVSGEDVHANWSGSLSPYDMYGTASHLKEVMTGDIPALFTDSPAGTLLFGGNPQLTNLVKDAAKWTNLSEDSKDHPTKLSNVAMDFLKLFGGLSNAYKARYAFETGKKLSTWTGKVTDTGITNTQALLMAAGIQDIDEAKRRYINEVMTNEYKDLQSDVEKFHEERKRVLLNDDITPEQFRYYLDMTNDFFRAFPHNEQAQFMYKKLVNRDIESGDTRILKQVMSMNGILTKEKAKSLVNLYPDTDEAKRQQYLDTIEFLYSGNDNEQEK